MKTWHGSKSIVGRDFRLDQRGQLGKRFLPTQVAHFHWNGFRHALLHDVEFRPTQHSSQGNGNVHPAWQVKGFELIPITNFFERRQFSIFTTERMAIARAEVTEGQPEAAASAGIQVVDLTGEPMGRQPLHDCVGFDERAINALGRCSQDTMKMNGSGRHIMFALQKGEHFYHFILAEKIPRRY
jgi:hypothetical protein